MLKNIFLLTFLFFSLNFSFSQEGSGNWKKGQTNRQTDLFVPENSPSSNTGYGTRGYMMLPSTTNGYDPGHRFLVYVKEGETVYFSFRASQDNRSFGWYYDNRTDGESNKFPVGTSGQGRTRITTTTGRSSTNTNLTPEEAETGPRPLRGNSGYTTSGDSPKGGSFTNDTGADRAFWLEFNNSNNSRNYNFQITEWDVTVVNAAQEQQTGRVYCRYWSMYNGIPSSGKDVNPPNNSSFHDDFTFFVPIDNTESESEGYFVKSINFGKSNAGWAVFFANSTGPKNTGDVVEDRKSSSDVSNLYEFPLFVAEPDEELWPSSSIVAPIVNLFFKRIGTNQAEGHITIHVEYPATVDIFVDLNDNGVFDGNDVVISEYFSTAGNHLVIWDGLDANNDPVVSGTTIKFISSINFFPVHFPVYDMEQSAGMEFRNIRPGTPGPDLLYWDHSNLTTGTNPADSWTHFTGQSLTNITGMESSGENRWNKWYGTSNNGFGNNRTINTWTGANNHYSVESVTFDYDGANLEVKKEVDILTQSVGENVTFSINLKNLGISWARNVEVEDLLPAGLEYVSHTVSAVTSSADSPVYNTSYDPTNGKWTIVTGDVDDDARFMPGDELKLEIVAKINSPGIITNTATVTSTEVDYDMTNNTASATVEGVSVVIANDDNFGSIDGTSGSTTTETVFDNDLLNGNPVDPDDVTLTYGDAEDKDGNPITQGGIVMNLDGTITVDDFTPSGTYTIEYTICEKVDSANCDSATVTIVVEGCFAGEQPVIIECN